MGGIGDGRGRDPMDGESWTEMESVQPDMVEAVPVRHGMVLGGRYVIEKIIGRGGAGVVVRAHDRDLQAVVAIKIVRAELVGQRLWAERLAREVKLARQIQHPHVCRVFDFEQADGRAFLVMELAERGSLRDEIRRGETRARPWAERIADARAVASALAAIHDAGIVHRDLTPQNLLRMADGRLVVSDFGLATDAGESTSVHGGTFAYMAPEVVRGGKSTRASDVWALGVVIHELVFGERPRWRDAASSDMLPPDLGRKLTRDERRVFETCRACTAKEAGWRVVSAAEAGRRLTDGAGVRGWLAAAVRSRRPLVMAGLLTVIAAVAAGLWTRQEPRRSSAPAELSPLIVPIGDPADWTDLSTVLAAVPERIHCTRLLPDQRTIRFVWGTPPRSEEFDTVTRTRVPSPLVPAAYSEGCPDLSPDGKRLVYQGHAKDGRPFAFLSQHPDGRDAEPMVQTAEPSMSSEPTWLADADMFSYDVDARHMGVFSVATNRATVLPDVTPRAYVTSFRSVIGNVVFVSTLFETLEMEFSGVSLPTMQEIARFRVPERALDLRARGSLFYYAYAYPGNGAGLVVVDTSNIQARRVGHLRGQMLRFPLGLPAGLAFVSTRLQSRVTVRGDDGLVHGWTEDGARLSVARCGRDLVASRQRGDSVVIERVDADGKSIRRITNGPADGEPECSPDGRVLYHLKQRGRQSVMRCDDAGCRSIVDRPAMNLAISPDGRQLALVVPEARGPVVILVGSDDGHARVLVETETACKVGWASARTLWVSRRRGAKIIWTEVDVESGRETGKAVPGTRDCSDGRPDPESPVQPDLRVEYLQTAQLRLLGQEHLSRP